MLQWARRGGHASCGVAYGLREDARFPRDRILLGRSDMFGVYMRIAHAQKDAQAPAIGEARERNAPHALDICRGGKVEGGIASYDDGRKSN